MTKISKDDVLRFARLSKIQLTDAQADNLVKDMNSIVGYVELLDEVDVSGVKPTAQVSGQVNVKRKDEIIEYGISQAELLKNTANSSGGSIKVPKVL